MLRPAIGIKLNSDKFRIPDSNNFYGILFNLNSNAELAKREIIIEGHEIKSYFITTKETKKCYLF